MINTQQELVTSAPVHRDAQDRLDQEGIKVDTQQLLDATTAQAVFNANLLEVTAKSEDPKLAAAYANAVADAFTTRRNDINTSQINTQIRKLEQEAADTQSPEIRAQLNSTIATLTAQRNGQADETVVAKAACGAGLGRFAEAGAQRGAGALRRHLLGVLLALLRDQLRPRFTSQRDLGQFLELPVLASVPELGRRLGVRTAPQAMRVEQESYQSLSGARPRAAARAYARAAAHEFDACRGQDDGRHAHGAAAGRQRSAHAADLR